MSEVQDWQIEAFCRARGRCVGSRAAAIEAGIDPEHAERIGRTLDRRPEVRWQILALRAAGPTGLDRLAADYWQEMYDRFLFDPSRYLRRDGAGLAFNLADMTPRDAELLGRFSVRVSQKRRGGRPVVTVKTRMPNPKNDRRVWTAVGRTLEASGKIRRKMQRMSASSYRNDRGDT